MTGEGVGRVRLRFLPDGPEVRVPPGVSLFDAASWNGVAIDSTCGGYGTCKKCKVRIVEGELPVSAVDPRAFSPDELRDGWRLACRAEARSDLVIDVPPLQTRPKAATVGVGRQVILRPSVQKRYLELSEPTLQDQISDLLETLANREKLLGILSDELIEIRERFAIFVEIAVGGQMLLQEHPRRAIEEFLPDQAMDRRV